MYANAKYVPIQGGNKVIQVDIEGITNVVPVDPANADYRAILASGTAIADIVPSAEAIPSITPLQASLWFAQHGKSDVDVMSIINAIADTTARLSAQAYWNRAPRLDVDNPLVPVLWAGLGLKVTPEQAFREAAAIAV